jgi:hypothetical protein
MSAKRYSLMLLYSCAALSASGITFNFVVDPYSSDRFFHTSDVARPGIYRRVKLAKAYDIRRIRPEAIVLGSSRSHVGLRMSHPGWTVPPSARYNGAFDGATTKEMFAYLLHAQSVHPVKQVVLGLDTWHLTRAAAFTRPDFDPDILFQPDRPWHNAQTYLADLSLLGSIDTVWASVVQLTQRIAEPQWLAPDGQRLGEIFFRQVEPGYRSSPGAYFRDIDRQEVGFVLDTDLPASGSRKRSTNTNETATSFDYIAKIVEFCRENQIDLRLFITPAHAHQMEIISAIGGWSQLESGKRDLVKLLANDAARHPDVRAFSVYDFSGYSSVTMDIVPGPGETRELADYWDSSHFKERVGDWVLDRLFGFEQASDRVPDDFGVLLDPTTVDAALIRIRDAQNKYRIQFPADVGFIRALISEKRANNQSAQNAR